MEKFFTVIFILLVLIGRTQDKQVSDSLKIPDIAGGNGKELAEFYKKFKSLVKENDSVRIANLIFYPLHTSMERYKGFVNIYDKKSFLKFYHLLFDERMRKYVLSENLDKVFSNYQGIALGGGRIWIDQRMIQGKLVTKIMTISNLDAYWKFHNSK